MGGLPYYNNQLQELNLQYPDVSPEEQIRMKQMEQELRENDA